MHDSIAKSVVITGGNRGIGLGITQMFVESGFKVVVGGRNEYNLREQFGDRVRFVKFDARSENDHRLLAAAAIELAGTLDVYINNAGYSSWRPIGAIDDSFLNDLIDTNLKGVFWGCKVASEFMAAGSSIINISSLAGKRGSSNNSAYCATKFGVNGLTQSLAKELGPRSIRINAVCPVLIKTDGLFEALSQEYAPASGDPEGFVTKFAREQAALSRLPTAREVAEMCLFLASDRSSAVTGQCINVDCGVLPQ